MGMSLLMAAEWDADNHCPTGQSAALALPLCSPARLRCHPPHSQQTHWRREWGVSLFCNKYTQQTKRLTLGPTITHYPLTNYTLVLAGLAQLVGCRSLHRRVAGSILHQSTCLGCRMAHPGRACAGGSQSDVLLSNECSSLPPLHLSLKINKYI